MKQFHPIIITIIAGLLLWLSWPTSPLTPLVFFGFVPLMLVADAAIKRIRFLGHCLLAMLIWNVGATWWIWNSTDVGSIAAMVANSMLMCLPWWGYLVMKNRFGQTTGYVALIACWMAFEYIHLNWQLSWPWLNLGNVFAAQTEWIQWYEYTGIGGGTLWVLLVNVSIYHWLFGATKKGRTVTRKSHAGNAVLVLSLMLVPVVVSLLMDSGQTDAVRSQRENVVIVQPNIDPYGKFESSTVAQQIATHLELSRSAIDSNTSLVIWPETALSATAEINTISQVTEYQPVLDWLAANPQLSLLSGIETYRWYGQEKPASPYARKTSDGFYYDSYNAAISLRAGERSGFYVKSKLVPGVETLPPFLNFMGPVFEQFGGTTGGYAMDTASTVFRHANNIFITAPIICYESVYGEYVASYVRKGANLLTIITNDGWWGNTPGHKQHLHYARLRAIETRRWIARSANTGISAVIDLNGQIRATQPWDVAATIKYTIPPSGNISFYVQHGDYLYRIFTLLAGLLVIWNLVLMARKQFGL